MPNLYSYIIKIDAGSAPNPFWNICTLAICKPAIRRTASVGDWIIATGSKNSKCNDLEIHDLSGSLVYAMKVSKVLTMKEYDKYCKQAYPRKIPNFRTKDWRDKVGDSIYDFEKGKTPAIRLSVHNEKNQAHDLGGLNVLVSNHFYYFGEEARPLPSIFKSLINSTQGHRICRDEEIISKFEKWISQFRKNKIYADSQKRWKYDKHMTKSVELNCMKAIYQDC